ncbi:MAG: diguanylate cyclase domain-containing protein [Acidimicrobiales bacterium]
MEPDTSGPETEDAIADRHADDVASLHAIACLAPGEPDDRLALLLEAGCAALALDCGLVMVRSGEELAVRVAAGPRVPDDWRSHPVVEDWRVSDAVTRRATVATLGGPAAHAEDLPLGAGPLVACPLWVTGRIAGAIAFTGEEDRSPFTSWQLALVDLVADGASRVLEREADIRSLVRLESQAQAMIAAMPDPIVRVRRDGHRLIAGSELADGFFDPCATARGAGTRVDAATESEVLSAVAAALDSGEVQTRIHAAGPGPRARQVEARYARSGPAEVLCIVRDITDQHRAELALADQVAFEAMVTAISTTLISCASDDLDLQIERGLHEIAQFFGADLAYIDELSPDGTTLRVSHQWRSPGHPGRHRRGDRVDVAGFGWLSARFERDGHVFTRGTHQLPHEATDQAFVSADDRGALWVRLGSGGEMAGVLGLTWRTREPPETDEVLGLVRFAADAFLGAIRRRGSALLAEGQAEVFELIARGAPLATALLAARSLLQRHTLGATAVIAVVDDANRLSLVTGPDDVSSHGEDWVTWFSSIEPGMENPFGQAVVTGERVLIGDIRSDPRFQRHALPTDRFRGAWILPVRSPRNGQTLAVMALLSVEPGAPHALSAVSDSVVSLVTVASERSIDEIRLAHQATHDPLTKVGNRAALLDRLELVLARAQRSGRAVGVLFCDLDGFKAVNDRYGHDRGDRLLVEVANRITNAVRPSDTVCRTGCDEFVVVCEDLAGPGQVQVIADRVRHAIAAVAVDVGDARLEVTASVGVAVADLLLDDPDRLLRTADLAMYATKQRRAALARERGIDPRHPAAAGLAERVEPLADDLAAALAGHRLELEHQAVVGRDGSLAGVEVQPRWHHDTLGLVGADRLRAVAEPNLAGALGRWVRCTGLSERRRWLEVPGVNASVPVHVSLSGAELLDPELIDALQEDLVQAGVERDVLVLEVAERDLDVLATRSAVTRLTRADFVVLVAGAGSGGLALADLADLADLGIVGIKVGPSLVERLEDAGVTGLEVVRSLVLLAHGLGWRSLAVGVDTDHQRATLLGFGVDAVQGRAVARPVSVDGFRSWLGAD